MTGLIIMSGTCSVQGVQYANDTSCGRSGTGRCWLGHTSLRTNYSVANEQQIRHQVAREDEENTWKNMKKEMWMAGFRYSCRQDGHKWSAGFASLRITRHKSVSKRLKTRRHFSDCQQMLLVYTFVCLSSLDSRGINWLHLAIQV